MYARYISKLSCESPIHFLSKPVQLRNRRRNFLLSCCSSIVYRAVCGSADHVLTVSSSTGLGLT